MKISSLQLGLLAAAMSALLLFGGCGASDSGEPEPAANQGQNGQEAPAAGTEDQGAEGEGAEGEGDKPSLDEVKAGVKKWLNNASGGQLPEGEAGKIVDKMTDCIAEQVYDQMSVASLQKLANGETPTDLADLEKLSSANTSAECSKLATS